MLQLPVPSEKKVNFDPSIPNEDQKYGGDQVKHGTGGRAPEGNPITASNLSHAQHHDTNHQNESKENNDSDDAYSDDPKSRTSASSRVNFSKLTAEEKERRCHNMSKEVKQLRRKIRNMEERLARANNSGDYRNPDDHDSGINDVVVQRAIDKVKAYKNYELSDQKDLIENLCSVINQERLKPDSLAYCMI